ncbi:uncharacterized protein LOC116176197 [Photinus pyralis]|uniref:uncharacterized protein LOC116161442 n=1 Tax=Photinus pyralis TaxID=7054 RepID=UPI0012672DB9|nr:uncharacterized protein LOC116161442 [Photinus pyralis]XP_031339508.1 uncharacterized protein LOC116168008 [Photinus pyralis]XP_031350535.1 uncharacterized protein LOC116176196 [Photinus pyralis]XP_031350537.1 uncharacterized protein LOC116176197 [Photinus pyralis]
MNILDVNEKVLVDNSIINYQYHTHQPYTTRFGNNDEIRIPIQEDMCTLPSESHLYIEGKLLREDGTASLTARFVNNGVAFLFSEIRYEINGIVVDSLTKAGLSSTMKALVSLTPNDNTRCQISGWFPTANSTVTSPTGHFNVCIPLKMLLGFAEDYRKVILNIRQELVLIRGNTDNDAVISTAADEALKVDIEKIYWKVPHIIPALAEELALTKYIDKKSETQIAFRSWETHLYPALPQTDKHTWAIKTATSLETPRYIIVGLQTDRDGQVSKDMSKFDHCDIKNIRVFLNTERYPYDNLNINFGNNRYATLYDMYAKFQSSYYGTENRPLLTPKQFKDSAPLIVIDCSNQKEGLNSKSVVLRIEFETNANVANNTTAYCLILHDRLFTYNALTKAVRQI